MYYTGKKKNAIPEATLSLKQKYYLTNKDGGEKELHKVLRCL